MKYINIVVIVLLLATSLGTQAAEKKDKAAKRAAMMMQKLKQDHAAEVAALQSKFDAESLEAKQKLRLLEGQGDSQQRKISASQKLARDLQSDKEELLTKQEALTKQIASLELALKEEKELLTQARNDLQVNDTQRKVLLSKLAESSKEMAGCQDKNVKLSTLGSELIHLYDSPGLYEKLMRSEPFFQHKRVELENILQGHDDSVRELKLEK